MPFQILTIKERWYSFAFATWMGVVLAVGFLPMSQSVYQALQPLLPAEWYFRWHAWAERGIFPLLAFFFAFSVPSFRKHLGPSASAKELLSTAALPLLFAFLFGWVRENETLAAASSPTLFWYLVCIPLGEELLFRKWLYDIIERVWARKRFSATNPFPAALLLTSVAFALWHLQNLSSQSAGFVILQLLFTFCTGLWLGYLRWKTGKIWPGILAHALLNFAASIL